jgi:hypothetical protein
LAYGWKITTFISVGARDDSLDRVSIVLKVLRPSAFARILKPLSAVVTTSIVPSLLNLKRGRICSYPNDDIKKQT